jgi:ATP-binding cassette, subfamily B, multidrug efflux pump
MQSRHSLLQLAPYLRRYRTKLALGFGMVLCTVIVSMISPWVLKYVVDDIQAAFAPEKLPRYAVLILGISVAEGFFRFWMRKILIGVSRDIEYDLRNDFFAHLQKLSLSFFQRNSTGDVMSRATNDLNAVRSVLGPGIMYSVTTVVTVVIASAILFRLNWKLTLLAYIPLVLASVGVKRVGRQIHDRFESIQEQFSHITTRVQENLAGIRVVKSFARESSEIELFRGLNEDYVRRSVSLIRLWGIFYPMMTALIGLSAVALLWYGGHEVVNGKLTLGEFVAFIGYLSMLTWPTIATGWVINIFQRGAASMDRILRILQTEPEVRDTPAGLAPNPIEGNLEIRDLSFHYPNTTRVVLHGITLTIPAGRTLAIVGQTGSGKSTLANLIVRLFEPPPGTIFIDGLDIRNWPVQALRKNLGYVPQETFLFSDTIRANVAFGKEEGTSDQEVEWATRISAIDLDIQNFPQGLQTFVGERGITLSGGQKQRVAISRAIVKTPKILILDDALSSVDTYTEERILQGLKEVMKDRTTILISHRISTVKEAHQIVLLHDGAIIEQGTHETLLARDGAYAALYQKQLLEEELATA